MERMDWQSRATSAQEGAPDSAMPGQQHPMDYHISIMFQPVMAPTPRQEPGEFQLLAVLSYTFAWLSALPILLFGSQRRLVRFHALQSLLFSCSIMLLDVICGIGLLWASFISSKPLVLLLLGLLGLLQLMALTGWLVGMVQAGRGRYCPFPIVGKLALDLTCKDGAVLK
jgi:uncharacterized membrane protein